MNKKYILMTAGTMDWRISGIFDTMEQILEKLKKDWGTEDLTMDEIKSRSWQSEYEIKIEESIYYPDIKTIRDNKINTIIN